MSDFYEIDFPNLESGKSGDAIALRHSLNGQTSIHVVDGGFQNTGQKFVEYINQHYSNPRFIDHVVASHPDGDHAGGLRSILESFDVGTLWMIRPWLYAEGLLEYFPRFKSADNLATRLREIYPNLAALEQIAEERAINIEEPWQGKMIGEFLVLSPEPAHYWQQLLQSEKTPESSVPAPTAESVSLIVRALTALKQTASDWGVEIFSSEETSPENEMSVVQFANICGKRVLLTADAGRKSLSDAADYLISQGQPLPGLDNFQVPHHGSRRNVSSEVLNRWLGPKSLFKPATSTFTAVISAAKEDEDHPRNAVIRACMHRGAEVITNQDMHIRMGDNAPPREGWGPIDAVEYPTTQEE